MKNMKTSASRQLMASAAYLFLAVGGVSGTQAQTAAPAPAPAPAPTQPEANDRSSVGTGVGGMGGMDHDAMGGMSGMSHGGGGMIKKMMCGFTEHLEARLAYLKTELKITDQQTPQWNAFADAWRAVAQKASTKCAAVDGHQMDGRQGVLGQLSMAETHMVDHLEVIRAQKAALEPLFNVLSDDQKKAANETLRDVMKVGMPMGGGGIVQHGGGEMDGMDAIQDSGSGMGGMGGMRHGSGGMGGMRHGGGGMGGMRHGGGGMGGMRH
jgi:hypothetical protein